MADYSWLNTVNLVFDDGPPLIRKTCQYALAVSEFRVTLHLVNKHQICPESRRDVTQLMRSLKIPNPTRIPLCPKSERIQMCMAALVRIHVNK